VQQATDSNQTCRGQKEASPEYAGPLRGKAKFSEAARRNESESSPLVADLSVLCVRMDEETSKRGSGESSWPRHEVQQAEGGP
jgi:hypothetical protein